MDTQNPQTKAKTLELTTPDTLNSADPGVSAP